MELKFGTITQANPMRIKLDGEETASNITYKRNAAYNPAIGDRVYMFIIKGMYIVQGKIV